MCVMNKEIILARINVASCPHPYNITKKRNSFCLFKSCTRLQYTLCRHTKKVLIINKVFPSLFFFISSTLLTRLWRPTRALHQSEWMHVSYKTRSIYLHKKITTSFHLLFIQFIKLEEIIKSRQTDTRTQNAITTPLWPMDPSASSSSSHPIGQSQNYISTTNRQNEMVINIFFLVPFSLSI